MRGMSHHAGGGLPERQINFPFRFSTQNREFDGPFNERKYNQNKSLSVREPATKKNQK